MTESVACRFCNGVDRGAAVVVIAVYAIDGDSYPIIPAEDYCICPCSHAWAEFFRRAIDSHPTTRDWDWTDAIAVMANKRVKQAIRNPTGTVGLA